MANFFDQFDETSAAAAVEAPAEPERTLGQTIYENVIGSGEVDTPGERLGQYIRGGTAAVARGMADVPALPANLAQLGAMGVEKALGMEEPSMVSRGLAALPDTREMLGAVPIIGPESEYIAPGKAGEYISTTGEFAGGAGLASGPRTMLRYGAIPGAASEAAGQATEGEAVEPYARTAAALLAPAAVGKVLSPFGGADPKLLEASKRARDIGLKPSAGQTVGSDRLRALEDTLQATPEQLDDLSALAMKTVGSKAPFVEPKALVQAESALSKQFDDILVGVESVPNPSVAQRAMDVVDQYLNDAPAASVTPRVRNVAEEIIDAATSPNPKPISLETFRKWRTSLGKLATSDIEASQTAARGLRAVIDEAVDEALTAAGRTSDIKKLAKTRTQWWNLIGLKDVASRAGQQARLGRVTPEALRASVKRTQGPDAISMGRGTDLADLAVTAEAAIPASSSVMGGGQRTLTPEAMAGAAAGLAGGGPLGMAAASTTANLAQQVLMNDLMQLYLRNQALPKATAGGMAGMLPGLLSQ